MKLPASLLAVLALAGCEQAVDFEHRSAPPQPTANKQTPVQTIRIIESQPAVAPKIKPAPQPTVTPTPPTPPTVKVKPKHSGCGDGVELVKCGMG